jgi:hypothetical protein
MQPLPWFERKFTFGFAPAMLPFFLKRLEGTIYRVQEKAFHHSEEQLARRLDDKWSVKENIGHLFEVDEISGRRISEITAGQPTLSRADIQTSGRYNEMDIRTLIERFAARRREHISRIRSLSEEQLKMTALHPRLKVPMNAVDLSWFDAEHDDHHLVRINIILEIGRKRS